MLTELNVWENAWPIRAAHFAGDRINLKSPSAFITDCAKIREPFNTNGAMNQQVCERSDECENPKNLGQTLALFPALE